MARRLEHLDAAVEQTSNLPPLSPLELFSGKHVLLIGTTGFLAKVTLSMLLERFSAGRIYCLIRSTPSKSAESRLFDEVLSSEVMAPLRRAFGESFDAYVRAQVEAVAGDISKPNLGIEAPALARLRERLDLVINSAGLVDFNPPLDTALEINTIGASEVARFAASLRRPRLLHVSTCFVAGERSGHVREDSPIVGYFPKQGLMPGTVFSWDRELRDLTQAIQSVKARTEDAALESKLRIEALARLRKDGREAHERTVRAAITNQRRRWIGEELVRVGMDRAKHWGWPNIYTYTKALGEQAIASTEGLDWAILRPAIVESSMVYPFPGWNEGMNTSAPLAYLGIHGQVTYPGDNDLILDVVPVDYVSSATLAASAALFAGESKRVYQVSSGDTNPCSMARVITLVGLYKRRYWKRQAEEGKVSKLKARLEQRRETLPRSRTRYEHIGAPALKSLVKTARRLLDEMEPERYGPFGGIVSEARKFARDREQDLDKVIEIFDLFMPFIWENRYVFRSNQTRELFARMSPVDRALLPFDPEGIDWHRYWLEVHLPGLEKWVFPDLEASGPKRMPVARNYRDLAEMFESRTEEHSRRVAFRILRKDDVADSYTYRDVRRAAHSVAHFLSSRGIQPGDRVLLVSEGRPEWGMSYFGIILAGATVVPVDVDLSAREITNIARASDAKGAIVSPKLERVLRELEGGARSAVPKPARTAGDGTALEAGSRANGKNGAATADVSSAGASRGALEPGAAPPLEGTLPATRVWSFDAIFAHAHDANDAPPKPTRRPEDVASIIFTSGTTGRPKGVVLTDRNFTGLTARMSSLFELNRTDSLLSVLPPHHTFEFSAGLLMPLASGASITYLEERTPELITRAFRETPVTAMIGVPAVWESLHRRLLSEISQRGRVVEMVIRALMRANRGLRARTRWNLGWWIFRPMHNAFGGRLRYLVSGGAPLKPALFKDLQGMGFNLYEGYGLTEASPVITVGWPRMRTPAGSVGWPLPGLEVRIHEPDENGVGEVIARGPTIMEGYLNDPEATKLALQEGWLHTGDQGRLDEEGRLYIVGRKKDVIIDTGGKNVYPDEIEDLYQRCPFVKDLSVVGVPAERGTGERVAALVVPDYEAKEAIEGDLSRDQIRDRIREHFREIGSKLPFARRVKIMHIWEGDLPRTSTRKVKRTFVRDQIMRLERALSVARQSGGSDGSDARAPEGNLELWIRRTIAAIAQRDAAEVRLDMPLSDSLGFDSLMQLELLTALESELPSAQITPEELSSVETVSDVLRLASRDRRAEPEHLEEVGDREEARPLHVPAPVARAGKAFLSFAQRLTYEALLEVEVDGRGNIPANRNFIVAANHASHLDMGLVKYALGELGRDVVTLAAKDYFFDDPLRRVYFENFTNLLPIDRHGSLKKSLRLASESLKHGSSLLIFPEGTRSRDGVMGAFKPAIGHLSLNGRVDILPMFLGGTHHALPVGAVVPRDRALFVRIGRPISAEEMIEKTRGWPRSQAYRHVADTAEAAVRKLGGLRPSSGRNLEPADGRTLQTVDAASGNGEETAPAKSEGDAPRKES